MILDYDIINLFIMTQRIKVIIRPKPLGQDCNQKH